MPLKHLTRTVIRRQDTGKSEEIFVNDDGYEIDALLRFRRYIDGRGNRATSLKRYVESAARFVDYLIECEVFGQAARPDDISEAFTAYPIFLRDGPRVAWAEFPTLATYAGEIGFAGLAPASFLPTLAAVNHFLAFARNEALKAMSALSDENVAVDWLDLRTTYAAIDGVRRWSHFDRVRLKQSLLGGNIRILNRIDRPRHLEAPLGRQTRVGIENKEFPLDRLADLLACATSHRDRALWSLLAGGGLRLHEALNLRFDDVDPSTGEIWVHDPNLSRFGREMPKGEFLRFKGRTMSRVYMYEPVQTSFWEALRAYLSQEFVGTTDHENDFLFQKLDSRDRARPLVEASDAAHQKQFKRAVLRADVQGPPEAPDHVWTLHSLRHSYGIYMLNFIPVPGGPGLKLTEVQMLMGHKSIESTKVYARHDTHIVQARVEAADEVVFAGMDASADAGRHFLPTSIAERLRKTADRIEKEGAFQRRLPPGRRED
ncbi:Tyrosine recombinase XerC [Methylobacterium adhaesivum]|uniref:Site-specific integrase n=1 Tax=Methylobacterium adhaesivum TaxID=333297 RepID=A0ABT8BK13_9HYPH|nr:MULTISPECIES: site-specific integrase [Methylobacterium]MDN3591651.1 site-specific integrase [Methylobacterium adhaesivum]GJD31216.1 Tyrosine recombinase XerC [Methylobacterium adhaesivum]